MRRGLAPRVAWCLLLGALLAAGCGGGGGGGDAPPDGLGDPAAALSWARAVGGPGVGTSADGVAALGDGSIVVAGTFRGTIQLGIGESAATSLVSAGGDDIYVARLGSDGALLWARRVGGSGDDAVAPSGLAVHGDGVLFLTGTFESSIRFGQDEVNDTTLVSQGFSDAFLARLRPDGTLAWVRQAGGAGFDRAAGVAVTRDDELVWVGTVDEDAVFNPGQRGETPVSVPSPGLTTLFVARYDVGATALWVRTAGSDTPADATDVRSSAVAAVGAGTDVVVTGTWSGTAATFGRGESQETTLRAAGGYVARYGSGGSLVWARGIEGGGLPTSICGFPDGACALTGMLTTPATFGRGQPRQETLSSAGGTDGFVARFDGYGTLRWAQRYGGSVDAPGLFSFEDLGVAIIADADGSCVLTGLFLDQATFGASSSLQGAGGLDVFLARYRSDGALDWVEGHGGPGDQGGFAVTRDPEGGLALAGLFEGTITFGAGTAAALSLTATGEADAFVVRLGSTGRPE